MANHCVCEKKKRDGEARSGHREGFQIPSRQLKTTRGSRKDHAGRAQFLRCFSDSTGVIMNVCPQSSQRNDLRFCREFASNSFSSFAATISSTPAEADEAPTPTPTSQVASWLNLGTEEKKKGGGVEEGKESGKIAELNESRSKVVRRNLTCRRHCCCSLTS